MPANPQDVMLVEMRERFQQAVAAESTARTRMLIAKKFRSGDQWPQNIRDLREGNGASGITATGPRPCLTIDRISQPIQQIVNQIKGAHFGIEVSPNGSGASDDIAEVYEGYFRRMQNRARAEDPTGWAAEDAVVCGLGWCSLNSEYCNDEDDDQDLCQERIDNSLSVYRDPSATPPVFRDGRFLFVTDHLTRDACKDRWDGFDVKSLDDFTSTGDQPQTWGDKDTVTIVKYWRVVPQWSKAKSGRKVMTPEVRWSICCATQVLEGYGAEDAQPKEGIWPGKRIPVFPVVGKLMNIDGQILTLGMVDAAIDSQRMVNYMYSGAVELTALSSKDPIVVDPAAIEGWEPIWQRAQVDSLAMIPARSFHPDNPALRFEKPYKMGSSSQIAAMVEMLARSEEGIKATTGIFDPSLGSANPSQKTKGGILALQEQSNQGNSNWIDAYKNMLIELADEGVTVLRHYLDRPGRIIEILDKNDDAKRVMLNQPFVLDQKGNPQPVMQGGKAVMDRDLAQQLTNGQSKFLDMTKAGKYAIVANVGKNIATQRETSAQAIGELIQAAPEYMIPRVADVYVESLSFPGHQKIAERLKIGNQFAADKGSQEATIQQLKTQLDMGAKAVEALTAHVNEMSEIIKTKQVEKAADVQIAQSNNQTKLEIAKLQSATQIAVADAKVSADQIIANMKAEAENARTILESVTGEHADHKAMAHDVGLEAMKHVHEMKKAQQSHEHQMEAGAVAHEQGLEAAAQPPPIDPNKATEATV